MISRKGDNSHHVYLLDTMNNVLGILVLALILTQVLDVDSQGRQLPKPGEIDAMKRHLAEGLKSAKLQETDLKLELVLDHEGKAKGADDRVKTAQARLDDLAKNSKSRAIEIADWQKKERAAQKALDDVRSEADLDEELARVTKLLKDAEAKWQTSLTELKDLADRVAAANGQALAPGWGRKPTVLWKPDTKAMFLCRKGKVCFVDTPSLQKAYSDLEDAYIQQSKAQSRRPSYEGLVEYGNRHNAGNDSLKFRFEETRDGVGCIVVMQPTFGSTWESMKDMASSESQFNHALQKLDVKNTAVIFQVWGDSFDTYIAAVKSAKKLGFRTTWSPQVIDSDDRQRIGPGGGSGDGNLHVEQ